MKYDTRKQMRKLKKREEKFLEAIYTLRKTKKDYPITDIEKDELTGVLTETMITLQTIMELINEKRIKSIMIKPTYY